jgi:hypothetical protein
MFRATISGLCVAHVVGTIEQGALMQNQANAEDFDAMDTPRLPKHHPAHGSQERSRQRLTQLQSNAQMLEHKYKAILHAKVEKVAAAGAGAASSHNMHVSKRAANEFIPKADAISSLEEMLASIADALENERGLNQNLIDDQEAVLDQCNQVRHDEFDMPRYMDYYFYAATMTHICDNFNSCWDAAWSEWEQLRDHTKNLEATQKLIWKSLKKVSCYVEKIKLNNPSAADIQACVSEDPDTSPLNITYEPPTQDACDICDVKSDMGIKETDVAVDKWWEHARSHNRIKTKRNPDEGIVNSVKIMYEMLEKKGLTDQHQVANTHTASRPTNAAKQKPWQHVFSPCLSSRLLPPQRRRLGHCATAPRCNLLPR